MEFNNLVKSKIYPILQKYDFEITEEFKDILQFESKYIKIRIIYNKYENSFLISIGKKGGILYPLGKTIIKDFFDFGLSLEQVSMKDFINNSCLFFEINEKVINILNGNIGDFVDFELNNIDNYNFALFEKQSLQAAEKAWQQNNFKKFIDIISKLNYEKLPKSYLLKCDIAKRKIN